MNEIVSGHRSVTAEAALPPSRATSESLLLVCKTPDIFDSSRVWQEFRIRTEELVANNPGHQMPLAYMGWVDAVLAWRQTVPSHLQFWDLDL